MSHLFSSFVVLWTNNTRRRRRRRKRRKGALTWAQCSKWRWVLTPRPPRCAVNEPRAHGSEKEPKCLYFIASVSLRLHLSLFWRPLAHRSPTTLKPTDRPKDRPNKGCHNNSSPSSIPSSHIYTIVIQQRHFFLFFWLCVKLVESLSNPCGSP